MKIKLLFIASLFTTFSVFSQNTFPYPSSGNIGIGTIAPFTRLTLASGYGGASGIGIDFTAGNANSRRWYLSNDNQVYGDFVINTESTQGNATQTLNRFYINPSGNVGIGTTTLGEKLTVGGNILASTSLNFQDNAKFTVTNASVPSLTLTPFSMPHYGIAAPNTTGSADLWIAGSNAIRMFTGGNPNPTVNILSGKVGIGSLNPDQKLTVKGKIHAEEIIVDLAVPADYVFQKYYTGKSELKSDYTMPTLTEIEDFTKKNKHLPEVPSAQEIGKNGLQLGEMNMILLQKVEELTLYAIEQQKKIENQNKTLEILTTRLNNLENKITK